MEIITPSSASFYELHSLILDSCNYKEECNHLFLICNDDWKVQEKICLHDDKTIGLDEDLFLMKTTKLDDFIEEEKQHLAYIYDTSRKSKFLIELVENKFGEKAEKPYVRRKKGTPPSQFQEELEDVVQNALPVTQMIEDSSFESEIFNSDDFEVEELDNEGFEVKEM